MNATIIVLIFAVVLLTYTNYNTYHLLKFKDWMIARQREYISELKQALKEATER